MAAKSANSVQSPPPASLPLRPTKSVPQHGRSLLPTSEPVKRSSLEVDLLHDKLNPRIERRLAIAEIASGGEEHRMRSHDSQRRQCIR